MLHAIITIAFIAISVALWFTTEHFYKSDDITFILNTVALYVSIMFVVIMFKTLFDIVVDLLSQIV